MHYIYIDTSHRQWFAEHERRREGDRRSVENSRKLETRAGNPKSQPKSRHYGKRHRRLYSGVDQRRGQGPGLPLVPDRK